MIIEQTVSQSNSPKSINETPLADAQKTGDTSQNGAELTAAMETEIIPPDQPKTSGVSLKLNTTKKSTVITRKKAQSLQNSKESEGQPANNTRSKKQKRKSKPYEKKNQTIICKRANNRTQGVPSDK